MANTSVQFDLKHSIHEISPELWQRLNPSGYPFLDHRFLSALEDSECIGSDSGWHPYYLVRRDQQAILPCFVKEHSYGEYVFDWSWAEAYHRHGLEYYPKLLWAAPFTPATGPRLLIATPPDAHDWQGALEALMQRTHEHNFSGWHGNFLNTSECELLQSQFSKHPHHAPARRVGCQFHWFNRQYRDFDHYLEHFTSRKRKSVRKERRRLADAEIRLERFTGADISAEDLAFFYRCYQLTYQKRRSSSYLNLAFFQQLRRTMSDNMLLVVARYNDVPLAAALYFFDQTTLYGRYWGCMKELDGLHFEACYYQGIEFCIEQGLQKFDPGTQGEHKISRGFEPVITHSLHWLVQPEFQNAVHDFVRREEQQVLQYQQQAAEMLPFREQAFDQTTAEQSAEETPNT